MKTRKNENIKESREEKGKRRKNVQKGMENQSEIQKNERKRGINEQQQPKIDNRSESVRYEEHERNIFGSENRK